MPDSDYPNSAGHRGVDTSIEGAKSVNDKLPRLQASVMSVVADSGERGATADEIAASLGWEKWRVRPRTSELRRMGRIGDSGHRRLSDAGISSIVWVAREHLDREATQ